LRKIKFCSICFALYQNIISKSIFCANNFASQTFYESSGSVGLIERCRVRSSRRRKELFWVPRPLCRSVVGTPTYFFPAGRRERHTT